MPTEYTPGAQLSNGTRIEAATTRHDGDLSVALVLRKRPVFRTGGRRRRVQSEWTTAVSLDERGEEES